MYSIGQIKKGLNNPELITREAVSIGSQVAHKIFDGNPFGEYIVEQDWDNLIILDACRYDLFVECNIFDGQLRQFKSRSCSTGSFVRQNFSDGPYKDIVYVSANPNPADHQGVQNIDFAAIEEVWDSGWDDELHTVPPVEIARRTKEAERKYPNKRLISHFLQPHYPWIGPKGREFINEQEFVWDWGENEHIWQKLSRGKYKKSKIWELYKENLEFTLPYVEELSDELEGKTVVTSDHGNAFGEYGIYGHPERMYVSALTRVPWLELPHKSRKNIEKADDVEQFTDDNISKNQLRDLGYIT